MQQHPLKGFEPSRLHRRCLLAGRFFERLFQSRFQEGHRAVAVHPLAQRLWCYLHVWKAFFQDVAQTFLADGRLTKGFDRQQVEKSTAAQTARAALNKAGLSSKRFARFIVEPHVQFLADFFVGYFNRWLFQG